LETKEEVLGVLLIAKLEEIGLDPRGFGGGLVKVRRFGDKVYLTDLNSNQRDKIQFLRRKGRER
jgi:hypothetical protein